MAVCSPVGAQKVASNAEKERFSFALGDPVTSFPENCERFLDEILSFVKIDTASHKICKEPARMLSA